jgi:hypothetical protein
MLQIHETVINLSREISRVWTNHPSPMDGEVVGLRLDRTAASV